MRFRKASYCVLEVCTPLARTLVGLCRYVMTQTRIRTFLTYFRSVRMPSCLQARPFFIIACTQEGVVTKIYISMSLASNICSHASLLGRGRLWHVNTLQSPTAGAFPLLDLGDETHRVLLKEVFGQVLSRDVTGLCARVLYAVGCNVIGLGNGFCEWSPSGQEECQTAHE